MTQRNFWTLLGTHEMCNPAMSLHNPTIRPCKGLPSAPRTTFGIVCMGDLCVHSTIKIHHRALGSSRENTLQ